MDFRSIHDARYINNGLWDNVKGIKGDSFVVMYYQRGFRWEKDINKLLKDINSYVCKNKKSINDIITYIKQTCQFTDRTDLYDFYCLQALSVQQKENGYYELIDGQQRLTSVFLIYELLGLFCNNIRPDIVYTIYYQRGSQKPFDLTRAIHDCMPKDFNGITPAEAYGKQQVCGKRDAAWFDGYRNELEKKIKGIADDSKILDLAGKSISIDLYYISNVAKEIVSFIEEYVDDEGDFTNLQNYFSILKQDVLFLWYDIPKNIDPKEEFVGLNSNKVELTDAELIKALVLRNYDNKSTPDEYGVRWEAIEQGLCQPELWAFISGEDKATRIELMLDLFARSKNEMPYSNESNKKNALFDWYEKYFAEKFTSDPSKFSEDIIKGIEGIYYRICEWYEDVEIYHYIGLLTCFRRKLTDMKTQEELIKKVFALYEESSDKKAFINKLKGEIKTCILYKVSEEDIPDDLADIADNNFFSYLDPTQRPNIQAILWLLNAWEMIEAADNNYEKKVRKPTIIRRLPFSQINEQLDSKKEWTLEHIMPQNPGDEKSKEEDKLNYSLLEKSIKDDKANVIPENEVQSIGNLALLTHSENSSISNGNLHTKRRELTQKMLGDGKYVPISTVNAFGLYYTNLYNKTDDPNDIKYWTVNNRDCYLTRIKECLKEFD
ncbi:MAG: DUF262 domain-containing HNH endonuclease family protein [Erysipelotrichaceae bacterium]|nr:DUF262 domain-containing HNH endonuclease family protein [Erysipelotrichaceae bacterium]